MCYSSLSVQIFFLQFTEKKSAFHVAFMLVFVILYLLHLFITSKYPIKTKHVGDTECSGLLSGIKQDCFFNCCNKNNKI